MVFTVQVFQDTEGLSHIKEGSLFLKTRVLHAVDVKPQVTLIYNGQDQAQRISGLTGIDQVDLGAQEKQVLTAPASCSLSQGP